MPVRAWLLLLCIIIIVWFVPEVFYIEKAMSLTLTTHRLIFRHGLVHTSTHELGLSRISGVEVDQGPMGKLLGYGTIIIHGIGDIFAMPDVRDVQGFYEQLQNAREGQNR